MTTESMNNHIPQVKAVTGLSRSMIYALVSIDRFPQPVKISDRSQYKYSLITKINFG